MPNNLQQLYGNIDIYLFDQLLKGNFDDCRTMIDVGCGGGRNLPYFLQNSFNVHGIDADENAINIVKALSATLAPANSADNFIVARVDELPYPDAFFDLAICSAVLHFANSHEHFDAMLRSIWRVLKHGGFLFARLASDIGIEKLVQPLQNGLYILPDGSTRYLVSDDVLIDYTKDLGATLFEPIKTTNVQNLRCMTTWCIRKDHQTTTPIAQPAYQSRSVF